jgi:glutamate N-acetyltransferase/amino-acid N-acetyltransferase
MEQSAERSESAKASFKRALDAGVRIAAGTDAGGSGARHGNIAREIELMALAGMTPQAALEAALGEVCLDLTRQLAADGEGAETLIVVTVEGARDDAQAKRVAKSIVNSPLVKTAVHGRDPNWGRVAMAVGKCYEDDILADRITIRFGGTEVYPAPITPVVLEELERYLASPEVLIHVGLGVPGNGPDSQGTGAFTVYGCDLTDGYVRINADYTT